MVKFSVKKAFSFLIIVALLNSVHAGKYDDAVIEPIDKAGDCNTCIQCPRGIDLGQCGENFIKDLLEKKGLTAHFAQFDSIHGVDIVAFGKNFVLFHESKLAWRNVTFSSQSFYNQLGSPQSGKQMSRTWLHYALAKMDASNDETRALASRIRNVINTGGFFARTGSLRMDNYNRSGHYVRSSIQFYRITDALQAVHAVESATETKWYDGPLLSSCGWGNQYARGCNPEGNELTDMKFLRRIFFGA